MEILIDYYILFLVFSVYNIGRLIQNIETKIYNLNKFIYYDNEF
jgi:hypothetical protein